MKKFNVSFVLKGYFKNKKDAKNWVSAHLSCWTLSSREEIIRQIKVEKVKED